MSDFNLLPWRERRRERRLWHWRMAGMTAVVLTCVASLALERECSAWLAQHQTQMTERRQQLQALQTELMQADLWRTRDRQAAQVQAEWTTWQAQQWQAWQLVQQVLSVPPRGVQIERMVWRDQQLALNGWTLSEGHLQAWLSRLQAQGLHARDTRQRVQAAQWSQDDALAAKRHAFNIHIGTSVSPQLATP